MAVDRRIGRDRSLGARVALHLPLGLAWTALNRWLLLFGAAAVRGPLFVVAGRRSLMHTGVHHIATRLEDERR